MNKNQLFYNSDFINFDSAATSQKPTKLIDFYTKNLNNKHLNYCAELTSLSTKIATYLFCKPEQITFSHNATTCCNIIVETLKSKINNETTIYISRSEHLSNNLPWINLGTEKNSTLVFFDIKDWKALDIKENSIFIISPLTNLDATLIELSEIDQHIQNIKKTKSDIVFVVDASQYIVHKPISLISSSVDYLFFSAHKFYGPFGIGVLVSPTPHHLNANSPSDFLNLDWLAIASWNHSFQSIAELYHNNYVFEKELELLTHFATNFPSNQYIEWLNKDVLIPIFLLKTQDIAAHDFLFFLEKNKILTRSGLCCSYSPAYKHLAANIFRVSLSFNNTTAEIDEFFQLLKTFKIEDCF